MAVCPPPPSPLLWIVSNNRYWKLLAIRATTPNLPLDKIWSVWAASWNLDSGFIYSPVLKPWYIPGETMLFSSDKTISIASPPPLHQCISFLYLTFTTNIYEITICIIQTQLISTPAQPVLVNPTISWTRSQTPNLPFILLQLPVFVQTILTVFNLTHGKE